MRKTIELVRRVEADFIFTNLVDFDSKYGHRNDPPGYAKALETFDGELPALLGAMREDDFLFITADHGCDPTDVSTDHTREYVPLLVAGPAFAAPVRWERARRLPISARRSANCSISSKRDHRHERPPELGVER